MLKIISGGQTGADQGGLFAALICNIETGGYATRTYKTLTGCKPALLGRVFKLERMDSDNYADRTKRNVYKSEATIRFAHTFKSSGEIYTLNAIEEFSRPYFDVDLEKANFDLTSLEYFIKQHQIINIAGNSEQTAPGICAEVVSILLPIFHKIKNGA